MDRNCLKIGCSNIRSLCPSLNDVAQLLHSENFDIFGICETWLHGGVSNEHVAIPDYEIFRFDRLTRGGGVCIYVKNHFKVTVVSSNTLIEQLWIKLELTGCKIIVGVVYNPGGIHLQSFLDNFEDSLESLSISSDYLVCLGDLNIDLLKLNNDATKRLQSILQNLNLVQINDEPTRITDSSQTLIDHIIVSNEKLVVEKGLLPELSDHFTIFCKLNFESSDSINKYITYRNFKSLDHTRFQADLRCISWHNIYDIENVDDKLQFLNENIIQIFDYHAPLKTFRCTKPFSPWYTDNIKLMCCLRDKALSKWRRTKNPNHREYYKQLRNYTTEAIAREKKAYCEWMMIRSKPRECWKFLKQNEFIPNKNKNHIPDHLKKPDQINDFFVNSLPCITPSEESIHFYETNRLNNKNFVFSNATDELVYKILLSINTNSTGNDGISLKMLLFCCPYLLPIFTHLINYILEKNCYPSLWKNANVIVFPKKEHPESYNDLRAISLLPTLSKLCEKVMEIQLRDYLTESVILPPTQSGFRSQHSCTTALLHVTDDIIQATDNGMCTILILLDFSRAFDTINHQVLIAILQYIGLSNDAIILLRNYISNRKQKVVLDGITSAVLELKNGVPQGSILGPLLFCIYISQITQMLEYTRVHQYADDTQIYLSFPKQDLIQTKANVQEDISKFSKAARDHCLLLNPQKSQMMVFGPKTQTNDVKENLLIQIDGIALEYVNKAKNLGLTIDSNFRFEEHVSKLLQKSYAMLKLIYRNRTYLSKKTKTILCESLVLSSFNYCDAVYGPCLTMNYQRKIQKVQNSCLRLIFGIRRRNRISYKLNELNWLNMYNRRLHHAACLFQCIIKRKCPIYLHQKIRFRTDVHHLNTRFRGRLTPPIHKTEMFKRSFQYQIAYVYNGINDCLKIVSIQMFKKKYKFVLLQKQIR